VIDLAVSFIDAPLGRDWEELEGSGKTVESRSCRSQSIGLMEDEKLGRHWEDLDGVSVTVR
jgi:hypothetical protein